MQKISRVYLAGCGYRTAWYEGNILPLTDPATGEPTNTILQLENGGGKTTLLSLIFSCFETEQNRFLKHLQGKHNRFSQYFDQAGAPGFIVVEWQMPPRTTGGIPYRLVVGQAVTVRNTTEPAEVDRLFFSFREQADLSLESLPTPNLAQHAAGSFADFSRWIHEQHRKHPDVFTTRNQDEWKRHLKGERLIDLEMLQMQVSFSAQEGGFDAFVNFKGESEFLKKFFGLTLDQAKAEEARRLVVQVCEKHARKPEFQRRRDELTRFRGTLNTFAEAARVYLDALRSDGGVMLQGVVLSQALQARAAEYKATIDEELQAEQVQRDIASTANKEADSLARALATVTHAWHRKRVSAAEAAKKAADGAVDELEAKGRHVRAARLQRDIKSSEKQIGDLEALAEQERENLQPARDHVDFQGALFRRALFQEEERVSGVLQTLRDRAQNRETQRKENQLLEGQAEREEMALAKEDAQLKAAEERREQRVATLVREGVLTNATESASEAIDRFIREGQTHAATRDDFIAQKKNAKSAAAERRHAANRERKAAADLDALAKSLQRYLADGEGERERLSQLPALLEAVESDVADPFSPLLPQLLSELLSSCSRQIGTIDVRLAEYGLTKQAIETTRVAGYSADVAHVVNVLREAGVRSALPFNEYIAKAVPDVRRARDLVMSDPARFLGVCVAKSEFETALAVEFGGRLPGKPVMVSVTALDPVPIAGERLVIPSENDAAFNIAAAATLASEIAGKVAADNELRKSLEARQLRAAKAVQDHESFLRTYGDGKLGKAAAEEQAAREDAQATTARAEALEGEAVEFDSRADTLEGQARDADAKHRTALETVRRLEEHIAEHERDRPSRLHRLGEMPALVAAAQEKRAAAREELERLQQEHADDAEKRASESTYHRLLGEERAALKYYDRAIDAVQQLQANPRPLEELRRLYKDAEDNYLTDEKNRLGSLSAKIQGEHTRKNEKTAEYIRDFKDVTVDMVKPYLSVNHDEVLSEVETSLRIAREKAAKDSADHALAVKEAKKSDDQDKALIDPVTGEVARLNLDQLEQSRAETGQKLSSTQERVISAKQEADKAKARADAKAQARSLDLTADNLVRKALGLGDSPDLSSTCAAFEAETGIHLNAVGIERPVLALQVADQVSALLSQLDLKRNATKKQAAAARKAFEQVKAASAAKGFVDADADVAQQMVQNSFEDTCRDAERLLTHLDDRIKTTEDTLANMQADFDACIEEISEVVRNGILTLTKACGPDKRVPHSAPYIGGKQVLKMRADFGRINSDARRAIMRTYLDWLAESKVIPARGTDLIADAVSRVNGKPLGLQVLKMSIEETEQYVPVEKISNSGGEGVVMAMFLYLVINQLRAENYADVQKSAGGPLILDNPFAKATSAAMWRAQLMLAKEMNVQLIFATAIQDYNALGEFQRFVRLRKLQNARTRRWHLEAANFTFTQAAAEVMA